MIEVEVLAIKQAPIHFRCRLLNLRTIVGQIGLLPNHMPYVTNLVEGLHNYLDEESNRHHFQTSKGVCFFKDNRATLLVDSYQEQP